LHCPKEDYVLSIGACDPVKGFDFIVKSLGLIDQSLRPKFVIISNAAVKFWEDYLKQLAIQVGVGLEIKRQISDDELVSFYNRAKLVVYAPYLEPFGLVPLEAMACGTPVVAVREGGVRESVVHNKTGILTERDELIFAEAIAELLANEEIRDRMGQRAIEAVKGFWSLKHAGERLLWHLERCLSTYESAEVRRQR
jgi:glycosyltransferase involved in cell wall biosynthesis